MNRRGVALLVILWFLVLASALTVGLLARGRTGLLASGNRIAMLRGHWAAEGCLAILTDGYHRDRPLASLDTVDLGGVRWCHAEVIDPGEAFPLARADARQLALLFGSDSIAAAILDWADPDDFARPFGAEGPTYAAAARRMPRNGPFAAVNELGYVMGIGAELLARVSPFLTVRGAGKVNLNAAPEEVLVLLPGMTPAYAREVVERRRRGHLVASLDDLIGRAPPAERAALTDAHQELLRMTSVSPESYVVRAAGGDGKGAVAEIVATLVPAGDRLVLAQSEVW